MVGAGVPGAVWKGVLELLYPSNIYCAGCGDTIDPDMPYSLCGRCVREIHWLTSELRTVAEDGTPLHLFRRGFSCARYESRTKEMLRRFKYGQQPFLSKALASLMLERISGSSLDVQLVIAVPMHRAKERIRGYNQATLLAADVAEGLGLPCKTNLLLRRKETGAMSVLSAGDRRMNLQNAFEVADPKGELCGKRVLLVDDITTTGTTADECSRVLLSAGVQEVNLLVFASGEAEVEPTDQKR